MDESKSNDSSQIYRDTSEKDFRQHLEAAHNVGLMKYNDSFDK